MLQRLRLLTGLVLFTYVASHLGNHALGLISLQAAEGGRVWFLAVWRHPLGTLLLYGSLTVHICLALVAIYRRRHFRIPAWELVRLGLGLTIPYFLLQHAFGTRVVHELSGIEDSYTRQMTLFAVLQPWRGYQQLLLLTLAWTHGALGIHHWLKVKPWHAVSVPLLRIVGILLPLLAVGGFVDLSQEVNDLAADPAWLAQAYPVPTAEQAQTAGFWRDLVTGAFFAALALTLAGRFVRDSWQKRQASIEIVYPDGRLVPVLPGTTVLEASRSAGIGHASLCGGRGRCSTCRVRVVGPAQHIPSAGVDEARVLRRVRAGSDVRLACQLRPRGRVQVFPLLPLVSALPGDPLRPSESEGVEREIAILFADLRGYSGIAEQRLPFDVVFLLNQYFAAMGGAIESNGGHLDKFIGDGIMALFGLRESPAEACRHALDAAEAMSHALERLNGALAADLREPLRIGIGIHVGPVIVGELGYGRARAMTAVGDAVNIASRLETLTKHYGVELVVSADVARRAGLELDGEAHDDVLVAGRAEPLTVYAVRRREHGERQSSS